MTELAVQSTDLALFRDEPGNSLIQVGHRELSVAIRRILIKAGLVIEIWTVVVNVYLIATQDWAKYCRIKIMERVDDMLGPWLVRSKLIGRSEEEQGALMDEWMAWLRSGKTALPSWLDASQSIEESDMVNQTNDDNVLKILARLGSIDTRLSVLETKVDNIDKNMATKDWLNLRFGVLLVLTFLAGLGVLKWETIASLFGG